MTIKDIARLSGCGVATVSRVLNHHPDVSEATRQRVMAVVEQHGFQPNTNAKHLKQQADTSIAILVKGTQNMLFADLVEKIQALLRDSDRDAAVYYLDEDANEVAYASQLCRERKPLGILFLGGDLEFFRNSFGQISIPCVLLTNSAQELGYDNLSSLTTDDEAAAGQVVEYLAEHYRVALLNSKNSWRILGQESYAYECAQWYGWNLAGKSLFVPVGNAGNITAIMSGLLKMRELDIIEELPRLFGVQSHHADPVWRYYSQPEGERRYEAVRVQPSVAQAAMIGNPVSFPRVRKLAARYTAAGGDFNVVQVTEQAIMDAMITANRHGHIASTQGGECLAGLLRAKELGLIGRDDFSVLDATAHALKFSGFQTMYMEDSFPPEFGVKARPELVNSPRLLNSPERRAELSETEFTAETARELARAAGLKSR